MVAQAGSAAGPMAGLIVSIVWIAVFWVAPAIVGKRLGDKKQRTNGLWYGFWLGWLGVLWLALRSDMNGPTLSVKQREVAELEAEIKLTELRERLSRSSS